MNNSTEISLIDCGITSITTLALDNLETASVINLHHNLITRIEGLSLATHLVHVDLSSNLITDIRGLDGLKSLRTLNLSSNRIENIQGLENLRSLVRLDLSFNAIANLDGLRKLHGSDFSLTVIHLQGNKLDSLNHLVGCTRGLVNLRQLTVYDPQIENNNPLCHGFNFREIVLKNLPQLEILDNLDSQDKPVRLDVLADIPELSPFLDYISSSSLSEANEAERLIQETCIQQALSRSASRPAKHELPNPCGFQLDSHNVFVEPGESANNHQQCSLSSLTERRLINLETQLSSLVAMQLMRLNQPLPVHQSLTSPNESNDSATKPGPQSDAKQQQQAVHGQIATTSSTNEALATDRPKSRSATNEGLGKKTSPDCIATPLNTGRRPDDLTRTHSAYRSHSSFTHKSTPEPAAESIPNRTSAQQRDEHPPGAPKRPNSSTACKSPKPTSSSHSHGKPIFPRRPSSTPGATVNTTHLIQTPLVSGDLIQPQKSALRKTSNGQKRLDTPEVRTPKPSAGSSTDDVAEKTLGQVLKELDTERTKRKESEQQCQNLTDKILRLESSAVDATHQLKQAFSAERRARVAAETQLRKLDARLSEVFAAVDVMRLRDEAEKSRVCEETSKMSSRLVELSKDYQDAISRAERAEKKLDEAQCAIKSKELEFKELQDTRYTVDSPEVTQLIAARVEAAEAKHLQTIKSLQEKLDESNNRFAALEDEFRMALRIEAERYRELFNSTETLKNKLSEMETCNKDLQQREESARSLVTELTTAIKEQKTKAMSQQKSNLLIQHNQKERIATLEAHLEEARTRIVNMENVKKEQNQLKAELAAQESLVAGLRAERRNWSEELAQQGSALAQDRGRLEAKIEAQALEICSLKKSLEDDADTIKIKTKIIDDQADSIRNLKKALIDTQTEIKRTQSDALQIHQKLDDQVTQLKKENDDSAEKIKRLLARKEELKDTIADLEAKLEELRSENETLNQRWHDRTSVLDKLEKQLEQMRRGWEEEQRLLITERDAAKDRASALQAQMERMDASFRKQLAATVEANDRAISAARSDAEMIRSSCENRVAEVEAEMRAVLVETEETKQAMESRLRKISSVLYDPVLLDNTLPGLSRQASCYSHTCPHGADWSSIPPPGTVSPTGRHCQSRLAMTPPPFGHMCVRSMQPAQLERDFGSSHSNSMQPTS